MKQKIGFISNSSSSSFILKPKSFIGEMILRNLSRIEVSERNKAQIKKKFYKSSYFTIEIIDDAIKDLNKDKTFSSCLYFYNSLFSFKESFDRKSPQENFSKKIFFEDEYQILKNIEIIFSKINIEEKNSFQEVFCEWNKFKKIMKKGEKNLVVDDETVYFKCKIDLTGDVYIDIIEELTRLELIELVEKVKNI